MILVGGIEDEGCNLGVNVDGGGSDGDDELVALNLVRADRGALLLGTLDGRQLFLVVDARPSLNPDEDVEEEDADE